MFQLVDFLGQSMFQTVDVFASQCFRVKGRCFCSRCFRNRCFRTRSFGVTRSLWYQQAPQFVLSSPNTSGGGVTTNFRKNGFQKNDLSQKKPYFRTYFRHNKQSLLSIHISLSLFSYAIVFSISMIYSNWHCGRWNEVDQQYIKSNRTLAESN